MKVTLEYAAVPFTVALCSAFVLYLMRVLVFRVLHGWAKKTGTNLGDAVVEVLKTPSLFWCVAIGIYVGAALSELSPKYVFYADKTIHIVIILSMTIAAANLASRLMKDFVKTSKVPGPQTGLAYGIVKGAIPVIGLLIILGALGVSITPLITAFGVGGLAMALALRDTLSNLFAGIHILMEKTIRVGDFIKIEDGQEGFVEDITWRTTRVRMLPNNMVVVPNNVLAKSVVTNYYLPEKRMSPLVPVSVSYASDPDKVERILPEAVKQASGKIQGLLKDPEPFARFIPGFGDSSLDFTLICQVAEFTDQYPVQHELRKRIFKTFRDENVEIPFPHRTIYLREEGQWKE